jgi:hypothetical protein
MANKIRRVRFIDRVLNPAEAEAVVLVEPEHETCDLEIRGRLVGPRCAYATTVEIAYPLRPTAQPSGSSAVLTKRVVVPEPNLWAQDTPFVYRGLIELWDKGCLQDQVSLSYGFRALQIGPRGLSINGSPVTVHCAEGIPPEETTLISLRQGGYNCLLVGAEADEVVWDWADRQGFLVLGRLSQTSAEPDRILSLGGHPSAAGWLIDSKDIRDHASSSPPQVLEEIRKRTVLGLETEEPSACVPTGFDFMVWPEPFATSAVHRAVPFLIRQSANFGIEDQTAAPPGFLGWVSRSPGSR